MYGALTAQNVRGHHYTVFGKRRYLMCCSRFNVAFRDLKDALGEKAERGTKAGVKEEGKPGRSGGREIARGICFALTLSRSGVMEDH